jgi:hypothetical protein
MYNRIPVSVAGIVVEHVDRQRARQLSKAPNASARRDKRTRQIVEITLEVHGSDCAKKARRLDPRKYSHDKETAQNPHGCWTFRKLFNAPSQP